METATLPRDTILHGDALATLRTLPDESVQAVITSPPYWGLRDYGVPGQLGLERTPDEYVARMVEVFAEVRRVLRSDGTCWLNLGDTFWHDSPIRTASEQRFSRETADKRTRRHCRREGGLKPKDLVGVPWMVAFALRADGWYLRSEIIWSKTNPLPESVRDRPTKSHEQIFLLTKGERYHYDAGAIMEPVTGGAHPRTIGARSHFNVNRDPRHIESDLRNGKIPGVTPKSARPGSGIRANSSFHAAVCDLVLQRNKRSVWTVATHAFAEAHFATFPPALIEPCILAGAPAGGIVLDPFFGAGTVGVVARRHSRSYLGIELNQAYIEMAERRIAAEVQPCLWTA